MSAGLAGEFGERLAVDGEEPFELLAELVGVARVVLDDLGDAGEESVVSAPPVRDDLGGVAGQLRVLA
jgi:hypothetical protein